MDLRLRRARWRCGADKSSGTPKFQTCIQPASSDSKAPFHDFFRRATLRCPQLRCTALTVLNSTSPFFAFRSSSSSIPHPSFSQLSSPFHLAAKTTFSSRPLPCPAARLAPTWSVASCAPCARPIHVSHLACRALPVPTANPQLAARFFVNFSASLVCLPQKRGPCTPPVVLRAPNSSSSRLRPTDWLSRSRLLPSFSSDTLFAALAQPAPPASRRSSFSSRPVLLPVSLSLSLSRARALSLSTLCALSLSNTHTSRLYSSPAFSLAQAIVSHRSDTQFPAN